MTSSELNKLLSNYNIKKRELALQTGYSWIAVHKWCKSERSISQRVERIILHGLHDIVKRRKENEENALKSIREYVNKYLETKK